MRISMISIALTIVVNFITIAVVTGFQNEIRKKVVGFSAPFFIMKDGNNNIYEADPIHIDQNLIKEISQLEGVKSVAPVIYKPALIRSEKFNTQIKRGANSGEQIQKQEVSGVVLKGINETYPIEFLKTQMLEGTIPEFSGVKNELIISKKICNDLHFKVGDSIAIFFVKKRSLMKRFRIMGIFETGIEKIDEEVVFTSLGAVQQLSDFNMENNKNSEYVSGFEVQIDDWDELEYQHEKLADMVELKPNEHHEILKVKNILDTENEIFSWLSFLDTNVLIIIVLMLIIGIINIGSVLLVMIVIRTNFIGILKSLGATNWSIRKIFLYHTGALIVKGMLIGNIIGLLACYLQAKFELIELDAHIYYLSTVPIELSLFHIVLINCITFLTCVLSLLIPSIVITRITPSKSIKFN